MAMVTSETLPPSCVGNLRQNVLYEVQILQKDRERIGLSKGRNTAGYLVSVQWQRKVGNVLASLFSFTYKNRIIVTLSILCQVKKHFLLSQIYK